MPFYSGIRRYPADVANRTIDRLLALRKLLHAEIPGKTGTETLLLATWNIRDFDSNKFGHGRRLDEAFNYIAEIIAAFDLVAVQEVNRDLRALERVCGLLGPDWTYIATDTTEGVSGSQERMAFVYDKRKVLFRHIAGEVVLPRTSLIAGERQFARTPFVVAFQSGWFRFNLATVHIYFGAASGAGFERRVKEIGAIAKFFDKRSKREKEDFILLGDFNVVSTSDPTYKALNTAGFEVQFSPETNLLGGKHYDQIAFRVRQAELELGKYGVLHFEKAVFRNTAEDFKAYAPHFPARRVAGLATEAAKRSYYAKTWRTFQMSDHLPLWVEIKIDFTDKYLKTLRK